MPERKNPGFSQIVCAAPPVQAAFSLHGPTRLWWKVILMLHGKPIDPRLSVAERTRCVVEGFRFYAWLYRLLAVVFLLLAPALAVLHAAESSALSWYWAAASFLAGLYLWGVSSLGYAGASSYATGQNQGRSSLLAFMVMILAFLSMFVAVASVAAQQSARLPIVLNLVAATTLFVFGIGSYMIEIVYLAEERDA